LSKKYFQIAPRLREKKKKTEKSQIRFLAKRQNPIFSIICPANNEYRFFVGLDGEINPAELKLWRGKGKLTIIFEIKTKNYNLKKVDFFLAEDLRGFWEKI
jgi:hypothetical protein